MDGEDAEAKGLAHTDAYPISDAELDNVGALSEPAGANRPSWRSKALCIGETGLFFSEKPEDQQRAKEFCGRCAVQAECLDFAISHNKNPGIWAGYSRAELRKVMLPSVPETFASFGLEARKPQVDAVEAVEDAMDKGQSRILYVIYPSGGKTNAALAIAERWLTTDPHTKILFLCHDNNIIYQCQRVFRSKLADRHTFGTLTGEVKDWDKNTFLFASFQIMEDRKEEFEPDAFDLVIVDESQHIVAETYEPTIDYFVPQHTIAMTGTPNRHDLQDIRRVFGHEVYSKSFKQALKEGLLARPYYQVMANPMEPDIFVNQDINIKQLNKKFFIERRDEEVVRSAQEEITEFATRKGKSPKVLIFTNTIEHADRIAAIWPDSRTMHSKNKHTLNDFRQSKFTTLVTVNMANEGIDIPDINAIVFFNRTDSEPRFIQQLARGLRVLPGKDECLVLDYTGNAQRIGSIYKLMQSIASRRTSGGKSSSEELAASPVIDIGVGTFEFKPHAIDILRQLGLLGQEPADYRSLRAFAHEKGYRVNQLLKLVRPLHMVLPFNQGEYWLPPGYVAELEVLPVFNIPPAQSGEYRLTDIARSRKLHPETALRKLSLTGISRDDLSIRKFEPRFDGDKRANSIALTDDHIRRLDEAIQAEKMADNIEGGMTATEIQNEYGIRTEIIALIKNDLGLSTRRGSVRPGTRNASKVYVPEDVTRILEHPRAIQARIEKAPDNVRSVKLAIKTLGITRPVMLRIIEELEIKTPTYRFYRRFSPGITLEDMERIRVHRRE